MSLNGKLAMVLGDLKNTVSDDRFPDIIAFRVSDPDHLSPPVFIQKGTYVMIISILDKNTARERYSILHDGAVYCAPILSLDKPKKVE